MDGGALLELAGPLGPVGPVRRVATDGWLPPGFSMFSAYTGNPFAVAGPYRADALAGYGTGRSYGDPDRARLLAVSEALERYCGLVVDERDLVRASAVSLGDDALDLDRVPRCSAAELRRAGPVLRRADKTASIAWVAGAELVRGRELFLPAVMVYLRPPADVAESFWLPISTGCAVHATLESALLNAVLEVVERDAIALTWLRRRPLPRLAEERLGEDARELIGWARRHGVGTHLFDATTDVGVPVVYCLQVAEHTRTAAQLVGCACGFDVTAVARHAVMETMAVRFGIRQTRPPRRYADFGSISDSAAAMGMAGRRRAFGFLLDDLPGRPVSRPQPPVPGTDAERLALVVARLAELGMSVCAADISTRELRDAGHVAVRVVVPELQPMAGRPFLQYRDHPRLFAGHPALGPVRAAGDLNPYPQPMA